MAGNIFAGAMIVLFVIIANLLTAFIQVGTTAQDGFTRCDDDGNVTVCESSGTGSFISAVADVTVSGLNGAPLIFNALYVLVLAGLLVVGVVLIVSGFIPTIPG